MLETFLEMPEVRGSRAATQALLFVGDHALERGAVDQARDAVTRAYVLAEQPQPQKDALLGLSEFFRRTGDTTRLEALDDVLAKRIPHFRDSPDAIEHTRALALARRDLAEAARLLPAQRRLLEPLLGAFATLRETGVRNGSFLWADRGAGAAWEMPPEDPHRAVLIARSPESVTPTPAGRALIPLEAPAGFDFVAVPIDLGPWQDARMLGLWLQEKGTGERSSGLYRFTNGRLELVLAFDPGRGGVIAGCRGDLDGDGRPEFYLAVDQGLVRIRQNPAGEFEFLRRANVPLTKTNDILRAMFAGDLEGDGQQELVVAVGDVSADLRVFRWNQTTDVLDLVARRKVGEVRDVAPFPLPGGRLGILALRYLEASPYPEIFPAHAPAGLPQGTYLIELKKDRLELLSRVAPPFVGATLDRLVVGDFNGDGLPDFALTARVSARPDEGERTATPHLQVAIARPGGGFEAVTLPGLAALASLEVDGDPSVELLVADHTSRALWFLGAGGTPLPRGSAMTSSRQADLAEHADVWDRVEDLLALDLTGSLMEQMRRLASSATSDPAAIEVLLHAAELAAERGEEQAAEELYGEVTKRAPTSIRAWKRLAQLRRGAWNREGELDALEAMLAIPGLPPAERQEAESRVGELKQRLTSAPVEVLFSQALDPHWRIEAPEWVRRSAQRQCLLVRSVAGQGLLARLPLSWNGDRLSLRFTLEVPRLIWGAQLEIGLRPVGSTARTFSLILEGSGIPHAQAQRVIAQWGPGADQSRPVWERSRMESRGWPVDARLELDPAKGGMLVEVNGRRELLPFSSVSRSVSRGVSRGVSRSVSREGLPPAGAYELFLATGPALDMRVGTSADIEIHDIRLQGVSLEPTGVPDPLDEASRRIAEGEVAEAGHLIERSGSGDPQRTARLHLLTQCLEGPLEPCFKALEALEKRGSMGRKATDAVLAALGRDSPALMLPLLIRLRGWEGLELQYNPLPRPLWMRVPDPEVIAALTTGFNALDLSLLGPPRDWHECHLYAGLYAWRGEAFRMAHQVTQARFLLHRGVSLLDECASIPMPSGRTDYMHRQAAAASMSLAKLYLEQGQLSAARVQLERSLELSLTPELDAETLLAESPELLPLIPESVLRWVTLPSSYDIGALDAGTMDSGTLTEARR